MHVLVHRKSLPADDVLQHLVRPLARRLGLSVPDVTLLPHGRPLALVYGLRRPTILLSTWMLEHLDETELEAVLAHELSHLAYRDQAIVWLATFLRDAFCYLPPVWLAYGRLKREKELASDELATRLTGHPLALASALARVWEGVLRRDFPRFVPTFADADDAMEERISRLLHPSRVPPSLDVRLVVRGLLASSLALALTLPAAHLVSAVVPLGCAMA